MDKPNDYGLRERLKKSGFKFTEQRNAVLEVLINYSGQHLSTEEVYNYVKAGHPEIGLATVYRTLLLLEGLNMVYKLDFDDGISRYEITKHNEDHSHHHLICKNCGSIAEVEDDLLDYLEQQILENNRFLVTDHKVKFYGLCENCRKSQENY
jgi:Fur family ferric uptake transcriptional regulator